MFEIKKGDIFFHEFDGTIVLILELQRTHYKVWHCEFIKKGRVVVMAGSIAKNELENDWWQPLNDKF